MPVGTHSCVLLFHWITHARVADTSVAARMLSPSVHSFARTIASLYSCQVLGRAPSGGRSSTRR
eukprot:12117510-Alexandrium_andersonii.AAC.1